MVSVEPYAAGDVYRIQVRLGDPMGGPLTECSGAKWSMKVDGKIVACIGLQPEYDGVGNLWAYISDDARGHGREMFRAGARFINGMFEMGYHRIQCVIRKDRPEYARWIRLFGFKEEGCLIQATTDRKDVFIYAKVKGG